MRAELTIDLNADLGEGIGGDAAMLEIVTSANIATGAHAGDDATMVEACRLAISHGVVIGAHVAYEDREGFGRRSVDIAADALAATVCEQILRLERHAVAVGGRVEYVKPHGALYHRIVGDAIQAEAVVAGVQMAEAYLDHPLAVVGLPGSAVLDAATEAGLVAVPEGFADRAYTAAATLVPRGEAGAVLKNPDAIAMRSVAMARNEEIEAIDGTPVVIAAESLCVHGDTPGAVKIARAVRAALEAAEITIARVGPSTYQRQNRARLMRAGRHAFLLEFDSAAEASACYFAAVEQSWPDLENIVLGARTVLFDGVPPQELGRIAAEAMQLGRGVTTPMSSELVELPVIFDGPDLDDVAGWWGVARAGVIEAILATELTSEFCGFTPGFAYLVGLGRETPRRESPRTSVPAGAVGIAAEYLGIYPRRSPGGWQIVGTLAPGAPELWDPARPNPALLAPGVRVRFVEVGDGS